MHVQVNRPRNANTKDTKDTKTFSKTPVLLSSTCFEKTFFVFFVFFVLSLGEQSPLRAVGIRRARRAVAQRRQRELREDAITAVAGVETVRREIRRLIQARVAEEIDDQHAL